MNQRLISLLESLVLNVRVINGELERLSRTDQFTAEPECLQLVENIRTCYLQGMEGLRRIEQRTSRGS